MNYDEARELEGGWHWTSMNDGVIRACPPCIAFRKPGDAHDKSSDGLPRREDAVLCEPHATKEEAERHFYDYCLEALVVSEWETARKCETGCETWTNKSLGNRGLGGYFSEIFLCDFHRHKLKVLELYPFKPGIHLVHS